MDVKGCGGVMRYILYFGIYTIVLYNVGLWLGMMSRW